MSVEILAKISTTSNAYFALRDVNSVNLSSNDIGCIVSFRKKKWSYNFISQVAHLVSTQRKIA